MKRRKRGSWEQFWLTYKHRPGSLIMRILVVISAILTAGILFSLILYILVNGVVHLDRKSVV